MSTFPSIQLYSVSIGRTAARRVAAYTQVRECLHIIFHQGFVQHPNGALITTPCRILRTLHLQAGYAPGCHTPTHFIALITICVLFLDNIYNIPICISILDTHPFKPPMVYVKPTSTMRIKPSENVDCNGTVDLPFLQDWQYVRLTYFLFVVTFCSISYKNVTYPCHHII